MQITNNPKNQIKYLRANNFNLHFRQSFTPPTKGVTVLNPLEEANEKLYILLEFLIQQSEEFNIQSDLPIHLLINEIKNKLQ